MSYLTKNRQSKSPQSAILPAAELDRILNEYQAALCQTAELVKLNDERDKLFNAMKESFDILFDEVESLKLELTQKNIVIEQLKKEITRLKTLKNVRKRLNQHKVSAFAVDTDE